MKSIRLFVAVLALLLTACVSLGAQAKATIFVQCNVGGAQIYLDGRLMGNTTPTASLSVPMRNYALRVSKTGYQDFNTTVNLTAAGASVQVNLIPVGQAAPPPPAAQAPTPPPAPAGKFSLSITSTPPGAGITVNGSIVGTTPWSGNYNAGTYRIMVSRGGYQPFNQTITLNSNTQINAVLVSTQPAPPPPPAQMAFSVNANVPGAEVFLNGSSLGRAPINTQVLPGSYNLTVRAPGYVDYNQSIVVNGPTQISANLQPAQVGLSVNANVQGAEVLLNGSSAGRTPFNMSVIPGSYNVTVRAPGYADYNQSVVVNGPTQVNANLQPNQVGLSVNANVQGAEVYLNGSRAGNIPLNLNVIPGSYNVTVRAPGYTDYSQTVLVNGPTQVNAILQGTMASWQVIFPDTLGQGPGKGQGQGLSQAPGQNKGGDLMISIDGIPQRGPSGQIGAGRHTIRITIYGMTAELAFDAQPGRSYSFEPFMGINLR